MEPLAMLPPINQEFAKKANETIPNLGTIEQRPLGLIKAVSDDNAILGWKSVYESSVEEMKVLQNGDSVIIDFGGHRTGYFSFRLQPYKCGAEPADSPCRLRLVFGEILNDVAESLEPYNAWLSKAWLPDEIINVDYLPQQVKIPRRHAFRYVKIEIIATSRRYGVKIENPIAYAVTSAPDIEIPPLDFTGLKVSVSEEDKSMLQKIDNAALLTLKNCMQTVYEDGPRRDMRLWLGDLRLQALTNYTTFGNTALAKRCLYLFAATPFRTDGLLSASCYEKPHISSGGQSIVDFSQLFIPALLDYVNFSKDLETGLDLFEVALRQSTIALNRCNQDGLYVICETEPGWEGENPGLWNFIDWHPDLDKSCAEHCVIIYGLRALRSLAERLSLPSPEIQVPWSKSPIPITQIIETLVKTAQETYFDSSKNTFVTGKSKQISWASNAWAILAEVPKSKEQASKALEIAYNNNDNPDSIIANTPYLHHYIVEAMIKAGLDQLALNHIVSYWGSMINAGAETFWETWDPKKPTFSPYDDFHSNSFCHAWSCTPSMLLRQLGCK